MNISHPEAVLDDVYYRPVELVDAYVSVIKDKKETSKIVKQLCIDLPLNDLIHLKRVKACNTKDGSLQVIVCEKDLNVHIDDKTEQILKKDVYQHLGALFLVKVPKYLPLVRNQYEESIQYWPVNFHEDKRVKKLLDKEYFSESELQSITDHMEEAIKCANTGKDRGQLSIGAVIVNPKSDQVIAKSHDNHLGNHPLQHAVMVCIDMVARSQGGGMWNIPIKDTECGCCHGNKKTSATCDGCGMKDDQVSKNQPKENTEDDSGGTTCTCPTFLQDTAHDDPYLCSGYDLYVTQEPCVMCAMALVHARIGRVFYGSSHKDGALGSKLKLHVQKGINHHYEVFTNVLSKKCEKLQLKT